MGRPRIPGNEEERAAHRRAVKLAWAKRRRRKRNRRGRRMVKGRLVAKIIKVPKVPKVKEPPKTPKVKVHLSPSERNLRRNLRRNKVREERTKVGLCRDCGRPCPFADCFKCRGGVGGFRFKLRSDRRVHGIEAQSLSWALLNHRLRFDNSEGGEE